MNATRRFAAWREQRGIGQLADAHAFHVAAFIRELPDELSPPTVKQRLAGPRMLFDWLLTGHILEVNPAHAVRGPKYLVKTGKTPVLGTDEARTLLDSIDASSLISGVNARGIPDAEAVGIIAEVQ